MPEIMLKKQYYNKILYGLGLIILLFNLEAMAREQIRIVGSSTLYPFITIIAEKFGKIYGHTPVVEATGTGGGFKLLCSGNSIKYPDIVSASRLIKPSEETFCQKNSVNNLKKILIGHDGIVIAQSTEAKVISLSKEYLFLALAKQVPLNNKMVDNPYKTWQEINPNLPNNKIEIYGPSSTSGTRDAFIELAMQQYCETSDKMRNLIPNATERTASCSTIREDGYFIEMPENYNLLIKKLIANKNALSVLSYSLLEDNNQVNTIKIDNIKPNRESIANRKYPLSRPLYLYINYDHISKVPGLLDFVNYLASPEVTGINGYLSKKGLITQ